MAGEFEITAIPGLRLKPVEKGLEIVSIAKTSPASRKFSAFNQPTSMLLI